MVFQINMPVDRKKALIIFAKCPAPGSVKTRLVPHLSPAEAAELYRSMLLDTLIKTNEFSGTARFLFYADELGADRFFRDIASGMPRLPQHGSDLGERMMAAFRHVFSEGYDQAVIIGTDSPDLPQDYILRAYELLGERGSDLVFGPSEDGGYYLLGMRMLHAGLFRNIQWSSASVLQESLMRAKEAGLQSSLLPRWYDVDQAEDLLRPELLDETNGAPLTREFIRNLTSGRLRTPSHSGNL